MDDKTLKALKASIAKWNKNARAMTPWEYKTNSWDCPLCVLFIWKNCSWCPVVEKTDRKGCVGTPYEGADDAGKRWRGVVSGDRYYDEGTEGFDDRVMGLRTAARLRAKEEVDFLKSLLPVDNQK